MKVNEIVYFHFTVFDIDGITPLTGQAGAITSVLRYNNTMSAVAVTIGEIGVSGSYYASFTPNAVGFWDVRVTNPDTRVVGKQYEIEVNDNDDIIAAISALESKVDIIDTNVDIIVAKLPTNNIMGSSVKTNKDDEIDAIKLKTDNLPADPSSESAVIAEIDANEVLIAEVIDLLENKLVINEANSTLNLYNDTGDTIIKTWPLTNKDGNNVVLTGTGPANRGKRTT
jgi:hypothetical protein